MKLFKYRFISLILLLFACANIHAQSIGSPNSTIVDLGKFKLNKADTITALPTFVYVPKNDTFAKYRTDSLLNHASGGNGNPNSNIGSGYRWAIPNTNNIKTFHAGLGFIIDSAAHANELTGIVDTAYLNSLYTSADTANFSVPDYLDSTGATQWRPLISLPNRKIGTSSKYVVDTTKFKLVINNKNVSFGGNRVNLSVSGNAFTSGFDSAGSFKKTGGTSVQFLKADGSVDANTYLTSTDLSGYTPTTRTISTTAPLTGGGDLSANRTIAITQSTTSTNGYLSSTDWNTFNGKQNAITTGTTSQYFRGDLSLATFPTNVSTFTNDAGYLTNTTGDARYFRITNNLSEATAATARTNLGATTVGANLFTLSNPSAVRYIQINADNSITLNSANAHLNALLPSQTGNNTKYLTTDGTNTSWATVSGGSAALSAITAATATNDINNLGYKQRWRWNSLSADTALFISANDSTTIGTNQTLAAINFNNKAGGQTSTALSVVSTSSGVNPIMRGIYDSTSSGGYAFVIPKSSGSVGIGTTTPAAPLEIVAPGVGSTALKLSGNSTGSVYPIVTFAATSGSVNGVIDRGATGDLYFGETADAGGYIFRGSGASSFEGTLSVKTLSMQGASVAGGSNGFLIQNTASNATGNFAKIGLAPHSGFNLTNCPYVAGYNASNDAGLTFGTYNSGLGERMRLSIAGNLLIGGTTDNGYKLEVTGGIKTTRPLTTSGSTPTNSLGTGAGTSPTASVTGNDIAGYVTINTGASPTASGNVITITFATALTNTPTSIQLTPANEAAATESTKVYIDQATASTTSFIIKNTSSALTASTTYKFYYTVTQ